MVTVALIANTKLLTNITSVHCHGLLHASFNNSLKHCSRRMHCIESRKSQNIATVHIATLKLYAYLFSLTETL